MTLYADGSEWSEEETTQPEFFKEFWPADAELMALVDSLSASRNDELTDAFPTPSEAI